MSNDLSTAENQEQTVWQKTKYANLVRYVPSGTLFARIRVRGKLIRESLKTSDLAVAKRKLAELERRERGASEDLRNGKMVFAEALAIYRERGFRAGGQGKTARKKKPLKSRSRDYYEQRIAALLKSWPELADAPIRQISQHDCEKWADRFSEEASASAYNHTISILRHILEIGVEHCARYDNPARSLGRITERPKKLVLPDLEKFEEFVNAIAASGSRFSRPCADLVRFLAYGGFRIGEATNITWADCDLAENRIIVYGDPEERTKNGEFRAVPMIPEMKQLLERLKAERPGDSPESPVMAVRECQKSMTRAAKQVGIARLTHHDLRHFFATRCIESGVDIPTVARWLGHKDGGALAMKTYGHLRNQHSVNMAQKVFFAAPAAPPPAPPKGSGSATVSAAEHARLLAELEALRAKLGTRENVSAPNPAPAGPASVPALPDNVVVLPGSAAA